VRVSALAAALVAAALLPGERLGIGVLLVALLVATATVAAVRPGARAVGFGAAALALAAFAAVQDAGWVVALDLGAAWLLGSVAVTGPSIAAPLGPFLRLRELPAVIPPAPRGLVPAMRGAVLGGFLIVPFAALLLTADAAFAEVGRSIPLPTATSLPGRVLVFAGILVAAIGLGLAARRPVGAPAWGIARRLHPVEWAIPLVLLNLLFLAFVIVQLAVLFGGHDHVLETAGLTYAEYARNGFWQLLATGALTLGVVAAAASLADVPRRAHDLLLRLLLGALCALTVVVLISALHRLRLYEDAFGLTRLRLVAEASGLWLGAVFGLVLVAGFERRVRRHLPSLLVGGTAAALLAFSLLNPDGLVAHRNVEHWRETGRIDVSYLRSLSADAVPALAELPPRLRRQSLSLQLEALTRDEPWSSANLARRRARAILVSVGTGG